MDVNANLVLMQYFENAKDLKPGEFVLLREGKVIDPLIHGKFTKEHPATIRVSDDQEIFAGDTLVYPKFIIILRKCFHRLRLIVITTTKKFNLRREILQKKKTFVNKALIIEFSQPI